MTDTQKKDCAAMFLFGGLTVAIWIGGCVMASVITLDTGKAGAWCPILMLALLFQFPTSALAAEGFRRTFPDWASQLADFGHHCLAELVFWHWDIDQ